MIPVFENINLTRRKQHLLFWASWVFSFTFIKSIGYPMPAYFDWLVYYIITLPVFVLHTYLIAYWLIPQFFIKKKYFYFFVVFLVFLFLFSVLELLLSNGIVFKYLSSDIDSEPHYLGLKHIIISGVGNHYIIVLFLSVKALKNWYTTENRKNELQRETIEAEIKLLRNQLQPRFLLSTIDLLEKMAAANSEKTPEMIIRVSNLMNNILLDNSSDWISLKKELNLIESYIDIQKLVHQPELQTMVVRSGDAESCKIPALSFFPLVEHIVKLLGQSGSGNDFKIFVRSEKNYLLFITSFYYYKNDPYDKLQEAIHKFKKRLSFFYKGAFHVSYLFENGHAELTIEVFIHD